MQIAHSYLHNCGGSWHYASRSGCDCDAPRLIYDSQERLNVHEQRMDRERRQGRGRPFCPSPPHFPNVSSRAVKALGGLAGLLALGGLAGLLAVGGLAILPAVSAQSSTDYDLDGDNLIEVSTLEQLNAIRYDLDGNGDPDDDTNYFAAFTGTGTDLSCHGTCAGYELATDLDFDAASSYAAGATNAAWTSGSGWDSIGFFSNDTSNAPYTGTFEGNRHTISNLFVARSSGGTDNQGFGLFATTSSASEIRNVGLVNVNVTGRANTGSLIGRGEGRVYASWATGRVTGTGTVGGLVAHTRSTSVVTASYSAVNVTATSNLGGLVGLNAGGDIIASYATSAVHCSDADCTAARGGLVGSHRGSTGSIVASYSSGTVTPNDSVTGLGGLAGEARNNPTTTNSYWDSTIAGFTNGTDVGTHQTDSNLKTPTGYTGIYANWNVDVDGVSDNDDPWDFGTDMQYPVLKVDFNGDGTPTVFGPQRAPGAPVVTAAIVNNVIQITITRGDAGGDPTGYQYRYDDSASRPTTWDDDNPTWTDGATFSITPATEQTIYYIEARATNAHTDSPGPAATFTTALDDFADNDSDDDNLIEVTNLEQLSAIRYDLNGDGHPDDISYAVAYSSAFTNVSCAGADARSSTCTGYELAYVREDDEMSPYATSFSDTPDESSGLDFSDAASYASSAVNTAWTTGSGWLPIGAADTGIAAGDFTAEFNGNGHAISNLFINRPNTDNVGLFASIGAGGKVHLLALKKVRIAGETPGGGDKAGGQDNVGSVAGKNAGTIRETYVTGRVFGQDNVGGVVGSNLAGDIVVVWSSADVSGRDNIGGLVGSNNGRIAATYATGTVRASRTSAGGLIGNNDDDGKIIISYATGAVTGVISLLTGGPGGLIGNNSNDTESDFIASYWDTQTSGLSVSVGNGTSPNGVIGKTTNELKTPTDYAGIYATWEDQDIFGHGVIRVHAFSESGRSPHYPKLTAKFKDLSDVSGGSTDNHFGPQHLGPVTGLSVTAVDVANDTITISWNHDVDDRDYYNDNDGFTPSIICSIPIYNPDGITTDDTKPCYEFRLRVRGVGSLVDEWASVPVTGIDATNDRAIASISPIPNPLTVFTLKCAPWPCSASPARRERSFWSHIPASPHPPLSQ